MSEELIDIPHKYDEFRHTNGVPYAFLEVPVAFLDETIPEGANWSAKGTEEEPEQKNVGEYTLGKIYSNDGTNVIITLAARQADTYRVRSINYDDLQDWETWLDTKGYTIDSWLTVAERNVLLKTSSYSTEED